MLPEVSPQQCSVNEPGLEGQALLLTASHALVAGPGEISLGLKSSSAMDPMCYVVEVPGKMCQLVQ